MHDLCIFSHDNHNELFYILYYTNNCEKINAFANFSFFDDFTGFGRNIRRFYR